jgi:hypothetical protein
MKALRFFPTLAVLIGLIACNSNEHQGAFGEPKDPVKHDQTAWESVEEGLNYSFASTNIAYSKSVPPAENLGKKVRLSAWLGEEIHTSILLWSNKEIGEIVIDTRNDPIKAAPGISNIQHRVVNYVLSDSFINGCGWRDKDTIQASISPDILKETNTLSLGERETRPVWLSFEVAPDCEPGTYYFVSEIKTISDTMLLDLELEVIDRLLPPPSEWEFHLDLWQNPYAVSRYHNVQLWSQDHLNLLRPLLIKLASAGQKCITTTLNDKPWGGQTYDPFGSMITWILDSNGNWVYDYSTFDQYVIFAMDCGIREQINCYSMVPWNNRFVYYNEASTTYEEIIAKPGTDEYKQIWTPFLTNFREHLRDMGWLDITTIAMDERAPEDMKQIIELVKNNAPEIKISLAGNILQPEIDNEIYDLSIAIGLDPAKEDILNRVESGKPTTFYTCCARPENPNNFTFSPPSDNTYIAWFASAYGYSGFLRWAYNSWVEDPVYDSRFRTWPSGDTYFIYPDAVSSVRLEKLIEGIRDYEKIRILKQDLAEDPSMEAANFEVQLNEFLGTVHYSQLKERPSREIILEGQKLLYDISTR